MLFNSIQTPFLTTMKVIKKIIYNKYTLTLLGFIVWVLFFDQKDLFYVYSLKKKVAELETKKKLCQADIAKANSELVDLQTNPKALEKFAREYYMMKKDDETIFIVDDSTTSDAKK